MAFFLLVTSLIFGWVAVKSVMLIHLIREKGIAIESYRMYFLKAVCIAALGYAVVGLLAFFDFPVISTNHEHLSKMWPFLFGLIFCSYLHALEITISKQQ